MRVLHVDKFLHRTGGAAAYMFDLASHQRARGDEVEHFSMQDERNVPATYSELFPPHVQLEPAPARAVARVQTAATMVWSRRAEHAMTAVVERFRPDVVHCHNIYHQLSPSILRPLERAGIPAVMTVHDYKPVCPTYRLHDGAGLCTACVGHGTHHAIVRACKDGSRAGSALLALESGVHRRIGAYGRIARFICPSRFLADMLRSGRFYPERLRVVPNFIDAASVTPRRGAGDGFVYVGRLSSEKGVDLLIEAVARSGVRLTVVGHGPEHDALQSLAARVAPGRVMFTGQLGRDDVMATVVAARAAVLCARWHENMPMSILEANAAAVPMVVSDLGGLPDLVTDGVTGQVVPSGDVGALAAALTRLDSEPGWSERLGAAARAVVLDRYDVRTHLAAVDGVYVEAGCRQASEQTEAGAA
jgi:glycosyltransferase involved in cell wall biosynthesis